MEPIKNFTIIGEVNESALNCRFKGEKLTVAKNNYYINATELANRYRYNIINWSDFSKSRQAIIKRKLIEKELIKETDSLMYNIETKENNDSLPIGLYIHPAMLPSLMIWINPEYAIELRDAFYSLN